MTRRPLGVESSATLARRTYTIMIGQRTIAAVTEWLPPGRLAAMTIASGKARAAPWQPFPLGRWPPVPPFQLRVVANLNPSPTHLLGLPEQRQITRPATPWDRSEHKYRTTPPQRQRATRNGIYPTGPDVKPAAGSSTGATDDITVDRYSRGVSLRSPRARARLFDLLSWRTHAAPRPSPPPAGET